MTTPPNYKPLVTNKLKDIDVVMDPGPDHEFLVYGCKDINSNTEVELVEIRENIQRSRWTCTNVSTSFSPAIRLANRDACLSATPDSWSASSIHSSVFVISSSGETKGLRKSDTGWGYWTEMPSTGEVDSADNAAGIAAQSYKDFTQIDMVHSTGTEIVLTRKHTGEWLTATTAAIAARDLAVFIPALEPVFFYANESGAFRCDCVTVGCDVGDCATTCTCSSNQGWIGGGSVVAGSQLVHCKNKRDSLFFMVKDGGNSYLRYRDELMGKTWTVYNHGSNDWSTLEKNSLAGCGAYAYVKTSTHPNKIREMVLNGPSSELEITESDVGTLDNGGMVAIMRNNTRYVFHVNTIGDLLMSKFKGNAATSVTTEVIYTV